MHTLAGSSLSGLTARSLCHPLDTVKSRLQGPGGAQFSGISNCLRVTLAEEGLRGLYRGFGAVTVLGTPAVCMYITSYDVLKKGLGTDESQYPFLGHFLAGMGAEAFSCLLFVPVDVVKERLQVQRSDSTSSSRSSSSGSSGSAGTSPASSRLSSAPPTYSGSLDALRVIARTEGLLGLYKGYYATLASFGPFSAFYFVFYEQARNVVSDAYGKDRSTQLPVEGTLAASAAAGAAASVVTCPLDLAKLRLQTQRRLAPGEPVPPGHLHGLIDAFRALRAERGVRGFFLGAGARVAFHVPNMCVTFTFFEECRKLAQRFL